jgi:hypothetical protein
MAPIDIVVLVITILLVSAVVFFSFVLPKIRHENSTCASCPSVKRAKRLVKEYKKAKDKKKD